MTATMEDLSPELLVQIFSHYIDSEGHVEFSRNVVPVCRAWWKQSLTVSLWKNVHVDAWKYLMSLSETGLLCHARSLKIRNIRGRAMDLLMLEPNSLYAVLSNIPDLKALTISYTFIDENNMTIIANSCPSLERFHMKCVSAAGGLVMTQKHLVPVLAICGPTLKHLRFTCCDILNSEDMISEIASKCTSLEVFEFSSHFRFPIYELMRGCPRLRYLELFNCEFVATDSNDCSGFKDLTVFKALECDFHGFDVCSLLKNSNNLEHLQLELNENIIFSDVSMIPSNKVTVLRIYVLRIEDMDVNLVALKQAVDKWKHTLLRLEIWGLEYNVTHVLKTYLDDNSWPKLEILKMDKGWVDQNFLKLFIKKCKNLKQLEDSEIHCGDHEKIIEFHDSL